MATMHDRWTSAVLTPLMLVLGLILGIQLTTDVRIPIETIISQLLPVFCGIWFGMIIFDWMVQLVQSSLMFPGDDDCASLASATRKHGDLTLLVVNDADNVVGEYRLAYMPKKARINWQARLPTMLRGWLGRDKAGQAAVGGENG